MTSAFCLFVFETFVSRLLALFGTIITSESGNPTRPGDKWERKLLVFGIFYSFLTSGRPLSSSTDCAIQWIVIYPMDSIIHFLNNWGLKSNLTCYISNTIVPRVARKENIFKEFSRPWKIVFELKRVFQQFRKEYLKYSIDSKTELYGCQTTTQTSQTCLLFQFQK